MVSDEYRITQCFACYSGFKCEPEAISPEKENKLRVFLNDFGKMMWFTQFSEVSTCNMASDFDKLEAIINKHEELLKYKSEIYFIRDFWDNEIYLNEEGRLCWYWEYDDDFTGGTSGIMPFCYSEEEAGNTWAYSEVQNLVESLYYSIFENEETEFVFPENIISDVELLKYVTKFLPKTK